MATDKDRILANLDAANASLQAAYAVASQLPDPPPPPPPSTGNVIKVRSGDNLQAALDAAATDTSGLPVSVLLEPKGSWTGNFVCKPKTHTNTVYVQPDWDSDAELGQGRDMVATHPDLPQLLTATMTPIPGVTYGAILSSVNSDGWSWRGIHFDKTVQRSAIVELGSSTEANPLNVATDWTFDQCRFIGDPTKYQKRALIVNCRKVTIGRCVMKNIGFSGEDGQCILGYNGPGPFTIVGNYLSGGAEPILFGGGTVRSDAMVPSDVIVRGNHVTLDRAAWDASKWTVKNLFEIKNVQRCLVEGNLFENVWTHGQDGTAIVLKAAGYEGAVPSPPLTRQWELTFRYNVVRNAGSFMATLYSENQPTLGTDTLDISHNVAYNLKTGIYTGQARGFGYGGPSKNVRVAHNTLPKLGNAFIYHWNDPAVDAMTGFKCIGNLAHEGYYGVFGGKVPGPGLPTIQAYTPGAAWDANVFEDQPQCTAKYPAGTTMVPAGTLSNGTGFDWHNMTPTDPAILAIRDAQGVPVGADVATIRSLFAQHGIVW